MKNFKNLSLLLAFVCAAPVCATEQEVPANTERPNVKIIFDAAHKWAVPLVGGVFATWAAGNLAAIGGVVLGAVVAGASRILGFKSLTAEFVAMGLALAIPSYLEARTSCGVETLDRPIILKFIGSYVKYTALVAFVSSAGFVAYELAR